MGKLKLLSSLKSFSMAMCRTVGKSLNWKVWQARLSTMICCFHSASRIIRAGCYDIRLLCKCSVKNPPWEFPNRPLLKNYPIKSDKRLICDKRLVLYYLRVMYQIFLNFLHPFLQVSQLEVPVLPANPIGVPLYDMDRRSWELEPDMGCM